MHLNLLLIDAESRLRGNTVLGLDMHFETGFSGPGTSSNHNGKNSQLSLNRKLSSWKN